MIKNNKMVMKRTYYIKHKQINIYKLIYINGLKTQTYIYL